MAFTVFEKIWNAHALAEREDGQTLLYIDRHLTHEVTSPLAFEGLRMAGRRVRRPDLTFAVMDHNVPTTDRTEPVREPMSAAQMAALRRNAKEFGIMLFDYFSPFQGIVHVIGPRAGPHTPRNNPCLRRQPHIHPRGLRGPRIRHRDKRGRARLRNPDALDEEAKQMRMELTGRLQYGVTAKDVILYIIRRLGTGGCIGHVVEFTGPLVREMAARRG
jgi:3-isopropylmalate/(R)-2-methylmalate dehydratase large subunit